MSMVHVLNHLGYDTVYDPTQTCCGQPAFNAGHRHEACRVACHFLDVFKNVETIVSPSGSCTAMVRHFYPLLFQDDVKNREAARVGKKVFEFSEFLHREGLVERISGKFSGRVGFHNSCHSYRELRLSDEPFSLLQQISGYELAQPENEPVCCGFGGIFSFKFPTIAGTMAQTRVEMFVQKGANTIVSNDPGCIMHMRQEAKARDLSIQVLHLAEFLERSVL